MDDTRKLNEPQIEVNNKNTYILDYEKLQRNRFSSVFKKWLQIPYLQYVHADKMLYYDLEFLIRIIPFKNDK